MTKEEMMLKDAAADAVMKSAPAIGGSLWAHYGITLNEVVALLTGLYLILQIILILPKIWDVWAARLTKRRDGRRKDQE